MSREEKKALQVACPVCDVFPNKMCKHTKGSRKGKKRDEVHGDRIRLAKVMSSESAKAAKHRLDTSDDYNAAPRTKKDPKEKLTDEQKEVVSILDEKIEALGKHAQFVGPVTVGPIISTYRFLPIKRTKVAHIESFAKDFAVALGADSILVKRMPGESAVGVFVPNKKRKMVYFPESNEAVGHWLSDFKADDKHQPIPLNFGQDSDGNPAVDDLTDQPHMLIAGATGGGKSTELHAIVLSLAWHMSPKDLRLIISDTKKVEFPLFAKLPHLQFPICSDLFLTMQAFDWCVRETKSRLTEFSRLNVRNIHQYNLINKDHRLPYVVIIIDELNDLIGDRVERAESKVNSSKLSSIVGLSRAAGIHVIAGTQRPDVKAIKGSIKANFPSRLSFRMSSAVDSKTILNTKGAEHLMARGDMLYLSSMHPELRRLHAPYTSLEDTKNAIDFIIGREIAANDKDIKENLYTNKESKEAVN